MCVTKNLQRDVLKDYWERQIMIHRKEAMNVPHDA